MKKVLFFMIISLSFLSGCSLMMNTPTKKVEELLAKYQSVDDDVKTDINSTVNSQTLTATQQTNYYNIIEKQFKNLTYTVKDEKVDGDTAKVEVEIEVVDYKKVLDALDQEYANRTDWTDIQYTDEKINRLNDANEKVKYTLEINVTKDESGSWTEPSLTDTDRKKILGMY